MCFRYYLHFDAKKGLRYIGDIAIDDISLSPECFGLNIPESELNGYNYGYYSNEHMSTNSSHVAFVNQTCKLIWIIFYIFFLFIFFSEPQTLKILLVREAFACNNT